MSKSYWDEQLASDGRLYYYNTKTGETSWTIPEVNQKPDAYFWKKTKDADGHTFYFNTRTKQSVWKRPAEYDTKIEKQQEIDFKRRNFFKMMSSSVQKDLNPIQSNSPSIFTIQEASARFDTDPRLIDATEKQRERFFDEWITLERKRRVELEKKLVVHAKERLKEKMYQLVEAKKFTIDTKWDDMITELRHNTDWRILLNYDRLNVFCEVKRAIHDEHVLTFNEDREQRTKQETKRRINYINAIKPIIEKIEEPLFYVTFETVADQIMQLPEYYEMMYNVSGSTAVDLFYDLIEEKIWNLDKIIESCRITEEDFIFEFFCEHFKDNLINLKEHEVKYIYESAIRDFLLHRDFVSAESQEKKAALIRVLKLNAKLVSCTSFEIAKKLLTNNREFNNVESEEEQKEIFEIFVNWGKDRTCEPGEILPEDDDWEDIGPMIDNAIRKRQFDAPH